MHIIYSAPTRTNRILLYLVMPAKKLIIYYYVRADVQAHWARWSRILITTRWYLQCIIKEISIIRCIFLRCSPTSPGGCNVTFYIRIWALCYNCASLTDKHLKIRFCECNARSSNVTLDVNAPSEKAPLRLNVILTGSNLSPFCIGHIMSRSA